MANCLVDPLHALQSEMPRRRDQLRPLAARLLEALGENPRREGLVDTPKRFAKALEYLTSGYETDIDALVGSAIFNEPSGELVFIRNIEFFSLCEHHMLPFFGKAHVAYVPDGKVIGLSKIPRIVDAFARRLQVQERLTHEIAHEIERVLKPKGVAVIIEASHLCMMMRGVEKQASDTITKATSGVLANDPAARAELFNLLKS